MTSVTVPWSMPVGTALDAGALGAPHHFVRERRGRDVDVTGHEAEQRVAHGAADDPCLLAIRVEQLQDARGPA